MMRLGPEPGQAFLVVGVLRAEHLDRHPAVNGQIGTPPDLTHPARGDKHVQPVPVPKHKPRHSHIGGVTRTRDDHSFNGSIQSALTALTRQPVAARRPGRRDAGIRIREDGEAGDWMRVVAVPMNVI
jgi:hypothetical protein